MWFTFKQFIEGGEEFFVHAPLLERHVWRVGEKKKPRTGREFKMDAQIHRSEIHNVMLDLGFHFHILPKMSSEMMGRPRLVYSPIQLWLANQYRIDPIGRLENVEVQLGTMNTVVYFEVIEIVDEKDTYPALLGFEWDNSNEAIINMKKGNMSFEADGTRIRKPLSPTK